MDELIEVLKKSKFNIGDKVRSSLHPNNTGKIISIKISQYRNLMYEVEWNIFDDLSHKWIYGLLLNKMEED